MHCHAYGSPPAIQSYYVSKSPGAQHVSQEHKRGDAHVWLHPQCSPAWHRRYRDWLARRSGASA